MNNIVKLISLLTFYIYRFINLLTNHYTIVLQNKEIGIILLDDKNSLLIIIKNKIVRSMITKKYERIYLSSID